MNENSKENIGNSMRTLVACRQTFISQPPSTLKSYLVWRWRLFPFALLPTFLHAYNHRECRARVSITFNWGKKAATAAATAATATGEKKKCVTRLFYLTWKDWHKHNISIICISRGDTEIETTGNGKMVFHEEPLRLAATQCAETEKAKYRIEWKRDRKVGEE